MHTLDDVHAKMELESKRSMMIHKCQVVMMLTLFGSKASPSVFAKFSLSFTLIHNFILRLSVHYVYRS
jgi:hypothetical protein